MTEVLQASPAVEHQARGKWFLALGVVLLALGAAAVGMATVLQLTSLVVFGPLLLTSSAIQLLTAFIGEKGNERFLHYGAAVLEAFLGLYVMVHPFEDLISLITVIAIFFMVIGLARLARSLPARSHRRAWAFLTGMVALLLGVSVWIGWPVGALWFVGVCIAVDLLCHGVSWSALALAEGREP